MQNLYLREIRLNRASVKTPDSFPFSLPIIKSFKSLKFSSPITYLIGENGTGKSTFMEAIAVCFGINPEGGNKNTVFSTNDTHSPLGKFMTAVKGAYSPKEIFFLRAESFYNLASYVDSVGAAASYGANRLHFQSHGEAFLAVLQNKFHGKGLYLLDEPEAALSPARQMTVLSIINRLIQEQSQFIIATHSPILMAHPQGDIQLISGDGIKKVEYTQTEHYKITRNFLDNTGGMLKILLD